MIWSQMKYALEAGEHYYSIKSITRTAFNIFGDCGGLSKKNSCRHRSILILKTGPQYDILWSLKQSI